MPYSNRQKRLHILELQRYLHKISEKTGSIPLIFPDGIYGSETRNAVRQFQKNNGLSETGDTDIRTWEMIVSEYRIHIAERPAVYQNIPTVNHLIVHWNNGKLMEDFHKEVDRIKSEYDNFEHNQNLK